LPEFWATLPAHVPNIVGGCANAAGNGIMIAIDSTNVHPIVDLSIAASNNGSIAD